MSIQTIHQFTDANFQSEVLSSEQPVLVDFWAPWCGPCRALGPTIDELATEVGDVARVGKVNVDDNQELAARYGIQTIPAVLIFDGGEVVEKLVGVQPKERYEQVLARVATS